MYKNILLFFAVISIFLICISNLSLANQILNKNNDNLANILPKLFNIYDKYSDIRYQHNSNVVVVENKNDHVSNRFLKYTYLKEDSTIVVVNLVHGCNITQIQVFFDLYLIRIYELLYRKL